MTQTQVPMGDIVIHFGTESGLSLYFVRVASRFPETSGPRICEELQDLVQEGTKVWYVIEKPSRFGVKDENS